MPRALQLQVLRLLVISVVTLAVVQCVIIPCSAFRGSRACATCEEEGTPPTLGGAEKPQIQMQLKPKP